MSDPFLRIRLHWQEIITSRGEGRATDVTFAKSRLPWLAGKSHITAVIYPLEHRLEFYDTAPFTTSKLNTVKPFWRIDRYSVSLSALSEIVPWPDCEGLWSSFILSDLAEHYRSIFQINDVIRHWNTYGIKHWWVIDRRAIGFSLVREFVSASDGAAHAVELSYRGLTIYKHDLLSASDLADHDQIMHLNLQQLTMPRLIDLFGSKSAIAIRSAARHYRLMVYEMALDHEQLPF